MTAPEILIPSPHPIPTGEGLPDGFHLEWEEETRPDWIFPVSDADAERYTCRGARGCPGRPVAALIRGGTTRWFYCEGHLYGRRVEGGKLITWRWVKDDDGSRV